MPVVSEIPLKAEAQVLAVQLDETTYRLAVTYRDADMGGWVLDIEDASGEPIAQGIPLVTGADLLAQYAYLGFGGALYVQTDGDPTAVPTYANLGQTAHLYWVPAS